MATETRQVGDRKKREFLPIDPKKEKDRFGSANEWSQLQLKLLGATFVPNAKKRLDLSKIVDAKEKWPPEIQHRTAPFFVS